MINKFNSTEDLSRAAADLIERLIQQAVSEYGECRLGLSGGQTPRRTYELLVRRHPGWENTQIYLVDERYVPPTDPHSNEGMIRSSLTQFIAIPRKNVHGVVLTQNLEECTEQYNKTLEGFLANSKRVFDVVVLGIGEDGHTASLFSASDLGCRDRLVMSTESPSGIRQRITLTARALAECTHTVFLATGSAKAEAVRDAVESGLGPAGHVASAAKNLYWYLDSDSASLLTL